LVLSWQANIVDQKIARHMAYFIFASFRKSG